MLGIADDVWGVLDEVGIKGGSIALVRYRSSLDRIMVF